MPSCLRSQTATKGETWVFEIALFGRTLERFRRGKTDHAKGEEVKTAL